MCVCIEGGGVVVVCVQHHNLNGSMLSLTEMSECTGTSGSTFGEGMLLIVLSCYKVG